MNKEKQMLLIRVLLIVSAIGLGLKYILSDFGIDAGFQVSMSYRHAIGDRLFTEMWEPYQMSVFLCAPLIRLYLLLFHTTTGVVLFLQFFGVLLDALISCLLFYVIKKYFHDFDLALGMSWFFFIVSPKDVPMPEYANMQLWFTLLCCIALFIYEQNRKYLLIVIAAFCLCGAILSYPSCLILTAVIIIFFAKRKEWKELLIFFGICGIFGGIYLWTVFRRISFDSFIEIIRNMLAIESSHEMSIVEKITLYGKDLLKFTLILLIAYLVAFLLGNGRKKENNRKVDALFFLFMIGYGIFVTLRWHQFMRFDYAVIFVALIILGLKYEKLLNDKQRIFYRLATSLSLLNFTATLILTNLVLAASLPYLLIAAVAALIPIKEALYELELPIKNSRLNTIVIIFAALFLVFRNGYLIRPLDGDICSILQIRGIVKSGPAYGIVTEYMGAYMQNESFKEWQQYVPPEDNIFLIGQPLNTLGYLFSNNGISAPSLVPTPGYNDAIKAYWELNPDKYPDVAIVSCWYGDLKLNEKDWVLQWLEEEFKPRYIVEGKYWRYYFR